MARFRNDLGEDRVVPTLGYSLVAAGATFTVPDEEFEHWVAGGFTPLDPDPAAVPAAPTPAAGPAPVVKKAAAAAGEGTETA